MAQRGPLHLNLEELSLYNGTVYPELPILLSIDETIFDVSASPHTYGPGGSYHIFAGRDASRAFVTGCFQEDLTSDLRGVERMYLPIEDVENEMIHDADGLPREITTAERKIRAEQERRQAKKKVREEVDRWVRFYSDHEKYFQVGKLKIDQDDHSKSQPPEFCESAEKSRPLRSRMVKGQNQQDR